MFSQIGKLSGLEFLVTIVLLNKDPSYLQVVLHFPNDSAGMFEIHFPPSK